MAKFQKGEKRPPNAGRKSGSVNKTTRLLKEAVLRAAELEGDQDLRRTSRYAHESDEEIVRRGGLVGYLRWLARDFPIAFASLLGRVLPMQMRVDSRSEITYRTPAEVARDMAERGFAIADLAPLLIEARPTQDEYDEDQKDDDKES
jgi:hypothetical protein